MDGILSIIRKMMVLSRWKAYLVLRIFVVYDFIESLYTKKIMGKQASLNSESHRHEILSSGHVVAEPTRCVQCGICSFNCPIGIDVRRHAWMGIRIEDSYCLSCGECVERCPRGDSTLRADEFIHHTGGSMTRHVIIGMGVAGISAALTLREIDQAAEIVMVTDDPFLYYSRPGLAYYLNDEIQEKQLYPFDKQDWKKINLRVAKGRALTINSGSHTLEMKNYPSLRYDRLLLATGAASVPLNLPGENLQGVIKLDDFEDVHKIIALTRHARTAVVIGGGVISLEMVEGLVCRGVKVHYFLRGDRYWTNVLDEQESRIIENRLAQDGVILHYRTEAAEILGRKGKVAAVRTLKGEIIKCDLVATCIGVKARTELARSAGLATERGILANEYLQTTDPDIFAAGDAAQIFDPQSGHSVVENLWAPGRTQGRIAGMNMAGHIQVYNRKVALNVLRLAGVKLTIIGSVGSGKDDDIVSVARGSSETWLQMPNTIATECGDEINNIRLMIGEKTLMGGVVMGDQKLSIPLQELVSEQVDITPIRSKLLQSEEMMGEVIMDFWTHQRAKA